MIELRPKGDLGSAHHGWLDTKHHFSFANYYSPDRIHWGQLRVWNDDIIAPNSGFPPHPHSDMEIITYVYEGAITHTDSLGNKGRTAAGDVQVMTAGTGVTHSEFNMEDSETRLFQIWIIPDKNGNTPSWGTKRFPKAQREGHFTILASGYSDDSDVLPINTQGRVLAVTLLAGQRVSYDLGKKKVYIVAAKGKYTINGITASAGDGLAIKDESTLQFTAIEESEIVMVEVI